MEQPSDKSFVVTSKMTKKFYESVTLLVGLNQVFKSNVNVRTKEVPCNSNDEAEEIFRSFVCKLGQLCDCRPHGYTVTAFAVLQTPVGAEYVFASNKRSTVELDTTKAYISSVLKYLGEAPLDTDEDENVLRTRLLQDILIFNLSRVKRYLNRLVDDISKCIAICDTEGASDSTRLGNKLRQLQVVMTAASEPETDDQELLDAIRVAIAAILEMQNSVANTGIQKRASDDRANNTTPWREVRHNSGRLVSYQQAVDILIKSRQLWPDLFHNFQVKYIASSKVHTNPLVASPLEAHLIIGRMLSGEEKIKYMRLTENLLQKPELDKMVEQQWTLKSFRPYVHAEVLLLNDLENTGGTRPARFFNNWRYIGCSKPTCRLCDYYFASHPSDVKNRRAHGNFYANWRFPDQPDVAGQQGDEAIRQRQNIIQAIGGHLKNEVLRVLRDGNPDTRDHDSNTMSSLFHRLREMGPTVRVGDWESVDNEADDDNGSGCSV